MSTLEARGSRLDRTRHRHRLCCCPWTLRLWADVADGLQPLLFGHFLELLLLDIIIICLCVRGGWFWCLCDAKFTITGRVERLKEALLWPSLELLLLMIDEAGTGEELGIPWGKSCSSTLLITIICGCKLLENAIFMIFGFDVCICNGWTQVILCCQKGFSIVWRGLNLGGKLLRFRSLLSSSLHLVLYPLRYFLANRLDLLCIL